MPLICLIYLYLSFINLSNPQLSHETHPLTYLFSLSLKSDHWNSVSDDILVRQTPTSITPHSPGYPL
ncbi:hypothetical protein HanXRQr2_Chr04g0184001 [Helianthus annuus]|uniref:Uncharacterized protein n=1 Tax=Helianthus annuus TaxID=4232 RepID=A0A9K3JAK2_HELAN|nr:hypothetical protein HanXRQr2_Chr04g0184001 [Helianthus annuus]